MTDDQERDTKLMSARIEQINFMVNVYHTALTEAAGKEISFDRLNAAITAAIFFAGNQFGSAIIQGLLSEEDKARMNEVIIRTFRDGVDHGKRHALTALRNRRGGGAA